MKALEYLLNFRTNKATMNDANGQVRTLKENILGIGTNISKVHNELTKFAHSQKWANIASLTGNVATGFTAVAGHIKDAFVGVYGVIDSFATEGDKVAKTSRLVGLSAKDYQGLAFAADRSGIKLETLNASLQKFNVNLGKAKAGDKTAGKMFSSLLPGNLNNYKDGKETILAVADSYKKLSATQKAFVSQELFGRGGQQMAELFAGGSDGVKALLQQYEDLGGGISDEAAQGAETFKDDLTNMNVTLNAMKYTVAGELVPAFSDLFKSITKYFKDNRGTIAKDIKEAGASVAKSVREILPKLPSILGAVVTIATTIAEIVSYIGPIKALVGGALIASLGSIVSIVTSLIGLIGAPTLGAIAAVAVGIGGIAIGVKSVIDNWAMLKSFVADDVCPAIKGAFYGVFGAISDGMENAIGKGIMNGIRNAIKSVPVLGDLIFSDVDFGETDKMVGENDLSAGAISEAVSGTNSTTTSRFAVDFKNMPKGVQVTPPKAGDFDWSYGYTLGGM